ncbi:MAG: MFS transporter [Pseudomonadota bacterium]
MATAVDTLGTQATAQQDEIPFGLKFYWSIGASGVAFMMNVVAGFAFFYMISVLQISPVVAGAVVFVPKIFDAFTDPIVGSWSDRLKTGKSRRRPFLLAGAILSSLSFLMVFTTPIFGHEYLTVGYIFTALMLFSFGYTLFNIPYLAMPAEMTSSYHERSSIHSFRMISLSTAGILGSAIPLILEELGRTSWTAYAIVGVCGAIFIFVTLMATWAGTANAKFTQATTETPQLLKEVRAVFSNPHFMRLIGIKFCQLLGTASVIAAFKFFVLSVMQRDFAVLTYYFLLSAIISMIASPIMVRVSKVIGKNWTYVVAAVCNIAAVGSWVLAVPGEPLWAILCRGGLLAIAISGNVVMAMSMLTDIINYDAKQNGIRREGVFTSFYTFVEKFTFAFGPLIVGIALSAAGFDKTLPAEEQTGEDVRQALLLGMSYIPAGLGIFAVILLAGYKLKEEDV